MAVRHFIKWVRSRLYSNWQDFRVILPGQRVQREMPKQMQRTYTTHNFMPMVACRMLIVAPTGLSLSSARMHILNT